MIFVDKSVSLRRDIGIGHLDSGKTRLGGRFEVNPLTLRLLDL